MHPQLNRYLVDARNWHQMLPIILAEMQTAPLIGFDIETQDDQRHEGLNVLMKVNPKTRKKSKTSTLLFDHRKTVVTGFSLYVDKSPNSYYINLNHADVENRLTWEQARQLLDAKPEFAYFVCHNAPFEICMMAAAYQYPLLKVICTLQMAVSAYGPDEYDPYLLRGISMSGYRQVFSAIEKYFADYNPGTELSTIQQETLNKVIAKESKAKHSYNGWIKQIQYGYGLKQAVKSWFDYDMITFDQVLGDKAHMGQLTGEEVAFYGCDDAYWAVQLYHRLLALMLETNPAVVKAFFEQENPMVHVYAQTWREGMRLNPGKIKEAENTERKEFASKLRLLRSLLRKAVKFEEGSYVWPHAELHPTLGKYEHTWYERPTGGVALQKRIMAWVNLEDAEDDTTEILRVKGPISTPLAKEVSKKLPASACNFAYYREIRIIMYDLLRLKLRINSKAGKVLSAGTTRGNIIEKLQQRKKELAGETEVTGAVNPEGVVVDNQIAILNVLNEMSSIEQRIKLYINPYKLFMDPDTVRVYPVLSSMLATRRMAAKNPNPMQLSKKGIGTYIRGFYVADHKDYLLISIDWSQIELVTIAELSGDQRMAQIYGQLPYDDMHRIAAAQVLEMSEAEFGWLKTLGEDVKNVILASGKELRLVNRKNEQLSPVKFVKEMRSDLGKGANFEYWYSGALSTTGEKMGWDSDTMWDKTQAYRELFPEAEEWRRGVQDFGSSNGYIQLPDNHRRVRYEATSSWRNLMRQKWGELGPAYANFAVPMTKRIQSRARNQLVNAMIQGTNATINKRSTLRIQKELFDSGKIHGRFVQPVHDELIFCIHKHDALEFILRAKGIMCNHPDLFKLPLDATASIGKTFEPFNQKKAPVGQFELDEAQECDFLPQQFTGKKLYESEIIAVINYMDEAQYQHLKGVLV